MPQYLVELEDGRELEVEADTPPTSDDLRKYFASIQPKEEETEKPKEDLPLFDLTDTASALGQAGKSLLTTGPASVRQMYEGTMNPWEKSQESKESREAARQVQIESELAQAEAEKSGDASISGRAIRSATPSLGLTASILPVSAAAGALAYGGTGLATRNPAAAQRAAMAAGSAASGYAAYRMAASQFLDDAREKIDSFFREKAGRLPTKQEQDEAYQELLPLAQEIGRAEALPEAFGNLALAGAGKYIYRVLGGKTGVQKLANAALSKSRATDMLKAAGAGAASTTAEVGTEAATEMLQEDTYKKLEEGIMKGQPVSSVQTEPYSLERFGEAAGKVLEPTLATTLLTAGVGGVGGMAFRKATQRNMEEAEFLNQMQRQLVGSQMGLASEETTDADKTLYKEKSDEAAAALKALQEGRTSDVERYFNVRFTKGRATTPAVTLGQETTPGQPTTPSPEVLAGLSPQEQAELGITPPPPAGPESTVVPPRAESNLSDEQIDERLATATRMAQEGGPDAETWANEVKDLQREKERRAAVPPPAAEAPVVEAPVVEEPVVEEPVVEEPVVEEPVLPPVANDAAIEAFSNVEASADVAPATAAVLEEIAVSEEPLPPITSTVTTEETETPARATFKTAKGSTYTLHSDGSTTRDKAPRPEHPGEKGMMPRSSVTLFVTPEGADALGIVQTEGGKFTLEPVGDGRWGARAVTDKGKSGFYKTSVTEVSTTPAEGLLPVEIWNREGKPQAVHFGNPITSTVTTEETETPVTPAQSDGGSQGQLRTAAEGSIPTVTAPMVPQEEVVSSGEIPAPAVEEEEPVATGIATPEQREAADAAVQKAAGKKAVRLVDAKDPGRSVIVARDPEDPQSWRATMFRGDEPVGHEFFSLQRDAVSWVFGDEATRSGEWRVQTPEDERRRAASDAAMAQLRGEGIEVDERPVASVPTEAKPKKPRAKKLTVSTKPENVEVVSPQPEPEITPLAGPLRPKFEKGETVVFTHPSGQKVVGTIERVSGGGNATIKYNWNGKKEQEVVLPTKQIERPVAALAEAPNYKLTQEQNAAKARKAGLPTEQGVTVDAETTIHAALDNIAADTSMPQMLRAIARALRKQSYKGVDLRIEADGRRWYAGYYLNDNGITEIGLNLRNVGRGQIDVINVFLHEALHHVTLAKVRDPQGELETESVQALDTLRKRVKAYAGMQQKATKFSYELGNVEEFITALFTRPDFQDFLASIPDTFAPDTPASKFRSVLSEIFRIISQLVTGQKVQKGSTMEQAITASLALFETPQRQAPRGQDYAMAEKDAEYMAAVERGDMAAAQRMVDEAAKKAIESNPRNAVKFGRFLGKSEYESARERIEELPREVFYVGDVEVIRNPTGDDIRGMTNEERSARGGRRSVDPDTRFTKDNYGNTWRWKATGGMHSMIEPSISRREGVEVNQNNGIPYHSDLVKDAIRSGEYIPSSTLSEYPNYADFVKPSSADPVTYDNNGNVIPLSERFQTTSPDIRFSATPETATPAKPLTETQARDMLTKRFGSQVADKVVVAEFPAISLRPGDEPVEVDAFLRGGKIHLNLKFIDSEEMLISKAEHEMAHAVWSNLRVQGAWEDLRASMPDDVKQRITDKVKELGYNPADIDEEVLVRFFEDVRKATPPGKWQAFMDAVIDAFRQFFGFAPDARTARLAAAKIIAEAESAVARGLDPVSAAFGASILPQAVIDKLDADYMSAVERGDMAAAQRMVDEAARAAGYNVGPVFHHGGFDASIDAIPRVGEEGMHFGTKQAATERAYGKQVDDFIKEAEITFDEDLDAWFWSSQGVDSYDVVDEEGFRSEEDARRSLESFASSEETEASAEELGTFTTAFLKAGEAVAVDDQKDSWHKAVAKAKANGAIAIKYRNLFEDKGSTSYIVFSPNQIKSADPVTYDNNGNVIPLSERFDLRSPDIRYSLRQQDRLRSQDWRREDAAINLQERRPQQETINEASKIIGDFLKDADDPFLARRKAFQFLLSDPSLRPETRGAGLGLLAQQMDMVASLKKRAGRDSEADLYDEEVYRAVAAEEILKNDPAAWQNLKFDIDAALANYSRDAGLMLNVLNTLNRLSPEGFVRRMEKAVRKNLDQATTAETGRTADELYNEIARIWQLMREAGPGNRGEAIAAALKAFMPQSISVRRIIDSQTPQAGFREKMEKEGEQLVRNFFQMIAGPRDPKGPLAEFDSVIQNALADSLRRAMEKAGLLKKNESVQMTDIDKMVRAVSVDSLRLGKLAKADEAMQAELNAIEDPERRATLQQAWDEAMARMATTVAPESVVRRSVNAELKDLKINWNEFFDKKGNVSALRDKVVKAVLDKVAAKLNIEGVMEPGGTGYIYLGKLQEEIKNAFDFAKEIKRQSWLAYREEVEVRRRIAERKKAFLDTLKNQKVAESALARIAESLAGPPKPGQPKNPVNDLVQAQIKSPSPDFVKKLEAEGVNEATAKQLEEMIEKSRQDAAEAKPFLDATKAVEQFIKSLGAEPTKRAVDVLTPLARKIVTGATGEALNRADFQKALAEAFNVPVLTKEQADEFTDLVRRIRALPEGVLQDDLKKELNAKVAMFDGIPAVDMLTSAWYANILSGLPTLLLQGTGNAFNAGLQSFLTAITSNPADTIQGFRGAFTSGLKQGLNEAMLALQGRSQFKPTATTDRNTISNLEILGKYGPKSWTDTLAYISSAGTLTKYVFRLFSAIDAFFQSTAREGNAYLAASKAARKVGKIGSPEYNAEFIKQLGGDTREFEAYLERAKEEQKKAGLPYDRNKIVQRAFELRTKERPATINALADRFANRITFTGKPEGIGRIISNFISAIQRFTVGGVPIGRLLLPFNQIVSNIFEQSLDYTPIGAARGLLGGHLSDIEWVRGKARLREGATRFDPLERRQRIAASVIGTTLGVLAYALADMFKDEPDEDVPFMIYGQGPSDKNKREALTRMGWSPNTIKIGDTFYRYSEYPLAMVFSAFGSAMDAERYEKLDKKDAVERAQYILMSAVKGMLNQGVLTNLKKTFEVLTGDAPVGSLKDMPVSAVKGLIPASGLLKDAATIMDPTKISADTLRAAMLRDIPFAKEYAGKPELNVFGEPIKFEGLPVVRRVAVQRVSDHVSDWMGRNFLTIPGMERTIEIGQYFPKDTKSWVQRKALQMGAAENGMFTSDQNYRFKERAGKLTKAAVESLMTLKKNPRPQEREALQKLINREVEKARKKAMLEIVKEDYL